MVRLADTLRETIEEEIATGMLLPGSHLDEVELATRFGVSRTPIREALNLLLGEGLAENRRGRGTVVTEVPPARLIEMFEVMAELEAMCARLASRRLTPVDLVSLDAAHAACKLAVDQADPDAYFYANERFHFALYTAAQNTFLFDQASALQRRLRPYRRLQLRVRNRVNRSFEEHEAILEALRSGDTGAAINAVRSHVLVQGERFADLIASLSRLRAPPADAGDRTIPLASIDVAP